MKTWLLRHAQVLIGSFGQLTRAPLASALTLLVTGITLALPAGLYVAVSNLERLSAGIGRGGQISVFLKRDLGNTSALKLVQQARTLPGVRDVDYISRDEALQEFRKFSGFGKALDSLSGNPLPAVLIVHPDSAATPADIESLQATLSRQPGVDLAELDLAWVKRLQAILELGSHAVLLLALLLSAAVLLIIANTIRMAVLSRRDEIDVVQLVGGTPAFIRRPFLYAGLLQGLLGGFTAWLLVEASLLWLSGPARELAELYGSPFRISGLGFVNGLILVACGGLLGWLGSRLAVDWQLYRGSIRQ